jgi:septal ring factor EnvC (AmiA/AmiB activator)
MNQDKVKTWVSSLTYYRIKKKNDDKKFEQLKDHSIKEGYKIIPKKNIREDLINVSKLVIISPILLANLLKKKEERKKDREQIQEELEKKYDEKIDKYEEIIKKEEKEIEDKDLKIAKLKDELRKIKDQMQANEQEEEYENHRRR